MSAQNEADADLHGLRLYRVELTQTIYVLAEDEVDALDRAPGHAKWDDIGEPDCAATEIRSTVGFDEDDLESLPHWERREDPPTVRQAIETIQARGAT